jgi:hypothetical protein
LAEEDAKLLIYSKTKFLIIITGMLCIFPHLSAQFTQDEVSQRKKWEEFMETADIVKWDQPWSEHEAVNKPFLLTLEKDGITAKAVWKNPQGWIGGYQENWEWEVAAYRLDKLVGINMVPPTIIRRFQTKMGSCQLFIEHMMTFKEKAAKNIAVPAQYVDQWNKATYLQRAWDNLIANTDRHQNQVLITHDWRMILIDHSRTFSTRKKYREKLIFDENHSEGPRVMKMLPAHIYNNLKNLTTDSIREAADRSLNKNEIKDILCRRDLIIKRIDERIAILGRDKVLY